MEKAGAIGLPLVALAGADYVKPLTDADRIIPRFHLEGVVVGRRVSIFKIDPGTGERLGLMAMATVGEGGWVDVTEPIIVRAGEAFIAVPDEEV